MRLFSGRINKISDTPAVGLLLLAPVLGELVSVHQRPVDFLNPLTFVLLCLPYGLGAILCREFWVRWTSNGIIALLFTGVAYGLFEEAIVAKSIFNPGWSEVGNISRDTFSGGIQWTYGYMLLHFHAFISISASIFTAEILYPNKINEQWVSNKTFTGVLGLFLLWIPTGILITRYFPNTVLYIGAWLMIILCLFLAKLLRTKRPLYPSRGIPPPFVFYIIGTVNTIVIFAGIFSLPEHVHVPLPVLVGGLLMFDICTIYLVVKFTNNGRRWTDTHKLALISGLITFFLLFGIMKDMNERFTGSSIVSILVILTIIHLFRKLEQRKNDSTSHRGVPGIRQE